MRRSSGSRRDDPVVVVGLPDPDLEPSPSKTITVRTALIGATATLVFGAVVGWWIASSGSTASEVVPVPTTQPAVVGNDVPPDRGVLDRSESLGFQGDGILYQIYRDTGIASVLSGDLSDAIVRGESIAGRRQGELVFLGPAGQVDVYPLDNQKFTIGVPPNETMALTPRPLALIPVLPDGAPGSDDAVLAREALDESEWDDVDLPGCGVAFPIALQSTDTRFAVWYSATDELRVIVDGELAGSYPEIVGGAGGPAIIRRGDLLIIVDWEGTIWTVLPGDPDPLHRSGSISLAPGESIPGIATASNDGVLYVGVAAEEGTTGGRSRASRLLAYDLIRGDVIWEVTPPHPFAFESLVTTSDGTIYAHYSAMIGDGPHPPPALYQFDPTSGHIEVIQEPFEGGIGRLLTLPANPPREFTLDDVELGVGHVWPETPRVATQTELAHAFAVEVLGWDNPNVYGDPEADPSEPVWVALDPGLSAVVELVEVLTVPTSDGGRVITEISSPSARDSRVPSVSVFPLPSRDSGSGVLMRVTEAAVAAEVTVRLTDGSHVVVWGTLGAGGNVRINRINIPEIADPATITSVLVRYVDVPGEVIAASGGHF